MLTVEYQADGEKLAYLESLGDEKHPNFRK
jgi:hypothetical protein